ncbi:glycosyltransferase family 2 protein [Agarivorans sp. 1_MG-2023]|uniref:glycosyltransferase family 2 protein n=1 Tax=Agarivorans sp. 1_MG-2023 TaxID=3062634 RepID=UPI0026E24088|nr:glycosyltransferase family 2 protein [Agarivorans sp. 1_MG-2023]MDO6764800.1 glycosyltransferase family 2 protein [Agarivorans sp. 1_MG-2023]
MYSLTIYIPSYNRSEYLSRTLSNLSASIEKFGLESDVCIVVSDNCSEDSGYSDIVHDYSSKSYFSYVRQTVNIGLAANINFGFSSLNFEYIWVLSDDDSLELSFVPKLISYIRDGKFDHFYIRSSITGDFRCDEVHGDALSDSRAILETYSSFAMLGLISANIYSKRICEYSSIGYDLSWTLFPHVAMFLKMLDETRYVKSKILGSKENKLIWDGRRRSYSPRNAYAGMMRLGGELNPENRKVFLNTLLDDFGRSHVVNLFFSDKLFRFHFIDSFGYSALFKLFVKVVSGKLKIG